MDFQSEYSSATSTINDIVSTQISSALTWANIPGSLVKASSSAAGFVWGYNHSNSVYVCALPCTGNWKEVPTKDISTIRDLTTDTTTVYILAKDKSGKNVLLTSPANNSGTWSSVPVPFEATSIFSTTTYIWAQDASNNKQKCAKPCTTGNWTKSTDTKIQITSSSATALYGKDGTGNAVKSDETLQSGWSPVAGFATKRIQTLIGDADQTALYGIDTSSTAYRCEGDCTSAQDVEPLDTAGYTPLHISSDPSTNFLWMTTTTPSQKGNVFTRLDQSDYSSIMNMVQPLDKSRDTVVNQVSTEYNQQTNSMVANKQIQEIVGFFSNIFNSSGKTADQHKQEISKQLDDVQTLGIQLDQIDTIEPIIKKLLIVVGIVAGLYLLGSFLGYIIHILAFIVLVVGVGYIIYSQR